ncbi:hypothetical protein CLOSTMETH_00781 [[Clostridium] methylpentosum DSM 5476]|uniref:Uncharacterized protein n=1 Tax=[Clostridium] methylpentosum DSM 5476 TaxID=537013 RepID=C0EAC7_9FIRM|nr:hypothetical protein CLOSTMETH_00781 [[Clostridium] methylpentosum DSM 5476]
MPFRYITEPIPALESFQQVFSVFECVGQKGTNSSCLSGKPVGI